ncbi:MAG: hypothetical protein HXX18_05335 [Bacteroidetes bacterium]|nr:hypothetical protein [Bacteroidota bacterium]
MKIQIQISIFTSFFLIVVLLGDCFGQTVKQKKSNHSKFCNIDEDRTIINGNDTIVLWPFELFSIATFLDVDYQDTFEKTYLIFQCSANDGKQYFSDWQNNFKINDSEMSTNNGIAYKWNGNKIILKLETVEDDLIREIKKGYKYKIIYCFESNSKLHRTNVATESSDGYYIVDIVEYNKKFPRQIPTNY